VLPGASELFRRTDSASSEAEVTELPSLSAAASSPALRSTRPVEEPATGLTLVTGGSSAQGHLAAQADELASFRSAAPAPVMQPNIPTRGRPVRRTDRTRHDEKITVYISADELMALESARLTLRGQHAVAVDRGRIVREAIAVLLADLGERGDDSVLVQRLRGR
jgi:hypothetical protein